MIRREQGIAVVAVAVVLAGLSGLIWWMVLSDADYQREELDYQGETTAAIVKRFGPDSKARSLWEIELDEELNHATCGTVDRPGHQGLLFAHRTSVTGHIVVEGDTPDPEDRTVLHQCREGRDLNPGVVLQIR